MLTVGDSYRALASAVITTAVMDAGRRLFLGERMEAGRSLAVVDSTVIDAIDFVTTDTPDLRFWCAVAGIKYRRVMTACRQRFQPQLSRLAEESARLHYTAKHLGPGRPKRVIAA